MNRIVILVDMDCFYCQVEVRQDPSLKGKPLAVVQYNQWKGGGIIAVNYEARDFGVTRSMRGDEARKKCPDIKLVHVPAVRGKADLTKYREAGREVVNVLCQLSDCVERASVDEAYIDVTEAVERRIKSLKTLDRVQPSQLGTTFVVGFTDVDSNDEEMRQNGLASWLDCAYETQDPVQLRLAVAGIIVEEMRAAVYKETGFRCSAGIAHNKILAKLACGLHKPNRQSILPQAGVAELYKTLPINKVRNLGGKFGCVVTEQLGCKVMADLLQFSESKLQQHFDEKTGTWLYNIARGIDHDPVTQRLISKSIGCCKKFPGKQALATKQQVQFWLSELSAEVAERLEKDLEENKRRAKLLTVSYHQDIDSRSSSFTRSGPLTSYEREKIAADAFELVKRSNTGSHDNQDLWYPRLKFLGLSVGKFVDENVAQNSTLHDFFKTTQKGKEVDNGAVRNINNTNSNISVDVQKQNAVEVQKQNENCKSSSVMDKNSDGCGNSLSTSFFMKFLKQNIAKSDEKSDAGFKPENKCKENLHPTFELEIDVASDDDMFESPELVKTSKNENKCNKKRDSDSTDDRKRIAESKSEASTSVVQNEAVTDNTSEMWISPGEIFPNLSQVDDDVMVLLPSPLQRKLKLRIEEAKNSKTNSESTKKETDKIIPVTDSDESRTPDSHFVGGQTQDDFVEKKPRIVKADVYKTKNMSQDTVEESSHNKKNSYDHVAPLHHPVNRSLSKNQQVLQGHKDEDFDVIEVCEDQASPSNAEQQEFRNGEVRGNLDVITERCAECGQEVPLVEYPEHLDFHAAEKLHRELNEGAVRAGPTLSSAQSQRISSYDPLPKRKRGRPSKKTAVVTAGKKMRSITAFFAPK
ncbi:DNA polymerase eta [Periplaneta americana]|uniref:DNA polymerase eta n=1 Tax=Periplaneta americana TaxID=6978 RepID=UPI0037E7F5BD